MKHYFFLLLLLATQTFLGCKKLVEIGTPRGQLESSVVFANEGTANSAIAAIYKNLRARFVVQNSSIAILTSLSSDDLYNYFPNTDLDQFRNNNLQESNSQLLPIWSTFYNGIYQANDAIEKLPSSAMPAGSKNQFIGEAKFIRGFCYFYLINLFGDVPLITTTDVNRNAVAVRSPISDVYDQIVADLLSAEELLPVNYGFSSNQRIRANKAAATALLARVYLYRGEWANAETKSSAVISLPSYSLSADLNSTFLANNNEAILQWGQNATDINTEPGSFIFTAQPSILSTNWLLNSFGTGDQRSSKWLKSGTYQSNTYFFPYKYKIITATASEYSVILRLAEQFLIRAEARARQNNIPAAVADINAVRQRAGLATISSVVSQDSCLNAVMQERRVELFAECGHRWFDLKRTNRVGPVLSAIKGASWQTTDALYPIPLSEIQKDPYLVQNPGY